MNEDLHMAFANGIRQHRKGHPIIVPHVIAGINRFDGVLMMRTDPSTAGAQVSGCHDAPAGLVREAVRTSREAQAQWEQVPLAERIRKVRKGIEFVTAQTGNWALRVALETGKPYIHARAEALETLQFLKVYPDYAQASGAFVDERRPDSGKAAWRASREIASHSMLRPFGVFGVITPFNYPICLAAGPAIAAVLAGNGVVIKTSHLAPWSGHAAFELFNAMELPVGLVNVVHGGDEPGKVLVASDVDGISFVGSAKVGKSIMQQVAAGPFPRPVIAEMGGKNPVIVTATADLAAAAEGIAFSAFDLTGQKCSALSRVLAEPSIHDELVARVVAAARGMTAADPADAAAVIGPVITEQAFTRYEDIIRSAKAAGFPVAGGGRVDGEGWFVNPVVISGVPEDHPLARDEHFLPILTVSKIDTFDLALKAANAVPYGLTAGIFTGDKDQAKTFLWRMQAGCINVNVPGHATTGWWPGPQTFGGWKASGSTGKQAFGKWYVQQFAREQAWKIPGGFEDLLPL